MVNGGLDPSVGPGPGPMDDGPDNFTYDLEDLERLESFTFEPVDPDRIADRLDDGDVLSTLDVPTYLDEPLTVAVETGTVLYRLTQLFGTPNVPGLRAGESQPDRVLRTWQYLMRARYEPDDGPTREWLVSVYDYKTNLSVGVSSWEAPSAGDDGGPRIPEPNGTVPPSMAVPEERFLIGFVQLVLRTVEEPVPATFKELWV